MGDQRHYARIHLNNPVTLYSTDVETVKSLFEMVPLTQITEGDYRLYRSEYPSGELFGFEVEVVGESATWIGWWLLNCMLAWSWKVMAADDEFVHLKFEPDDKS